jgi:3-oxoacyl-[acyl-carrier-protein] synthase-3
VPRAGIFGVGSALPSHIVTNADWAARLDTTDEWIVRRTGIRERHWLNGDGTLAALGARAAEAALADAGREAGEVDHVLVCTVTPDRITPAMAPEVARLLGMADVGAVDLNGACAGFLYGLDQAAALVESGRARCVLVCAAEALSRIVDQSDRGTAVLFGDGAGAAVVARGELDRGCGSFVLGSDGQHADLLFAEQDDRVIRMRGQEVYRHAVARMVESTAEALRRAGLRGEDLDLFVCHQANARIIESAAKELGIPGDRIVLDIDRAANTSSASIPLALDRAQTEGRLRPGATVGLAAFGAGFVWGAGVVSFKERAGVCV